MRGFDLCMTILATLKSIMAAKTHAGTAIFAFAGRIDLERGGPFWRNSVVTNSAQNQPPEFLSKQVTAASRFYLNLKPRTAQQLTVVCGGSENCAVDFVIDRKTFPYYAIEFVAAGSGELILGGKRSVLRPGTVFAYGPGVSQTIRAAPSNRLIKYFVDFIGDPSLRLLREIGLKPGTAIQVAAISDVRGAFDTLIRFGLLRDSWTERTCALQLELLFNIIGRSRQPSAGSDHRARSTFERVRQYIDNNFFSISSVQDITEACHVDSSHLSRLFRRFLSEPPLRYLQQRRMQWAADRLQESRHLVREVADELGLDPFQFSRTFKRVHGVSPVAFLTTRTSERTPSE